MELLKNVPVPPARWERQSSIMPTLKIMEVGDCFDIGKERRSSLSTAIVRCQDTLVGRRFTTRAGETTIRVWRIA